MFMMLWPDECIFDFADDGALLPPRKKNMHRKDGSFREDKSKGKLKSTICFADEFLNAPNFNDFPEKREDSLDKHLPLANDVPSFAFSKEEEWVPEETARLHDEFIEDIDREEFDRAHDEYLRKKKAELPADSLHRESVAVKQDAIDRAGAKIAVVDECKSDKSKKSSRRSASCPFLALLLPPKEPGKNLP